MPQCPDGRGTRLSLKRRVHWIRLKSLADLQVKNRHDHVTRTVHVYLVPRPTSFTSVFSEATPKLPHRARNGSSEPTLLKSRPHQESIAPECPRSRCCGRSENEPTGSGLGIRTNWWNRKRMFLGRSTTTRCQHTSSADSSIHPPW